MKKKKDYKHWLIINMPYTLLHELLMRKCLTAFINNTVNNSNMLKAIFTVGDRNILKEPSGAWLNMAFFWKNTEEGEDFWSRLHYKLVYGEEE